MAQTVTKAAEVKTAYSQPLPEPISFSYSYEELKKGDTVPEDEKPKDMEELVVNYVNAKRNSAARAKAQVEALEAKGIEAPKADDPYVITANIIRNFKNAGMSESEATETAKMTLGAKFAVRS